MSSFIILNLHKEKFTAKNAWIYIYVIWISMWTTNNEYAWSADWTNFYELFAHLHVFLRSHLNGFSI